MKIGRQENRSSAICASNAETIVVRGKDLCAELIGHVTFTDHVWLLIAGQLPTAEQRRVLDATLVAIAEHGFVPSVQAARMTFAAAPESMQGAVAAGLLGCGSVILGAAQDAGRFLDEIVTRAAGASLEDTARTVLAEYRAAKKAIPGYGHPLHRDYDPRARRLLAVLGETQLPQRYSTVAHALVRWMPEVVGKPLALNVSGAIAAVMLDAGYPLLALKGVPLLARTASLIAHLLEEQQRSVGFVLSHAAVKAIDYDGMRPDGFVPTTT
jgi:citrate synthase